MTTKPSKPSKITKLNITENFFGDDTSAHRVRRRTQLCTRVFTWQHCWYGSACNYAHDITELFVLSCNYYSRCDRVIKQDGKYQNIDATNIDATCLHVHPGEDIIDYCKRTGKFPTGVKPVTKVAHATPTVPTLIPAVVVAKKVVAFKTGKTSENAKSTPSVLEVKSQVKSQVKTEPAVVKAPVKARPSTDDDSALVVEFADDGQMVVLCKSDQDVQMAFKMALESKQSIRIKKVE